MRFRVLVLGPLLSLGACTAHRAARPVIAAEEMGALVRQPSSKAEMVTLHFTVTGSRGRKVNGPITTYPVGSSKLFAEPKKVQRLQITLRPNQAGKIQIIREFIYPTRLDLPSIPPAPAHLTPTTPKKFETENVGWTIDDIVVVPQGAFYLVHGRFVETTFDGFIDNPGDGFRPITGAGGSILTDNRAQSPTFTTRQTPFILSALPGKTYALPLNLRRSGAVLKVSCEGVDRSGQPVETSTP
jgi:hypothetical protein